MTHDVPERLIPVLGCPRAVEVMVALEQRSCTIAEFGAGRWSRREFERVLRELAGAGIVRRDGEQGSWDGRAARTVRYELTPWGRLAAATLNDIEVWTIVYERYVHRLNHW